MKAKRINDCRYDFIDNQGIHIFSFKPKAPITLLGIRQLQLASMLKGDWCDSFEEIIFYLSLLHRLKPYALGQIVNFFKLFSDDNHDKFITKLPNDIWNILATISRDSTRFHLFLIEDDLNFSEDDSESIEGFQHRWIYLWNAGIHTVAALTKYTRSELENIRCIGNKTIDELETLLAERGLHLRKEENK